MYFPKVMVPRQTREALTVFGGYDHNLKISDGSFYEMENMTSDDAPVLSPRRRRGVYAAPQAPTGLIAKDALCYVDGRDFVIGEYRVDLGLSDAPKQLVSMGAYVIILPDRKYINTVDLTDFGNIEAEVTTQSPVTFSLCREDGAQLEVPHVQDSEPEAPENSALWINTSEKTHVLMQWSQSQGSWLRVQSTYVKISAPGIGIPFSRYDGVHISGLAGKTLIDNASSDVIAGAQQLYDLEGSAVIWAKEDDCIVIPGILDTRLCIQNPVTVSRKMPDMDFVTECANRLWGCKYGVDESGETVNVIYGSKLGDFKNWNCFMGLATDSWFAHVGSDGAFTGAISHLGFPTFWKEDTVHKVYTSASGAHAVQDTACRGVQRGCAGSMAIVGETLFYKSRHGVCAYDGSLPVEVSQVLGSRAYTDAVAGAWGSKYYISMRDAESGGQSLFVFDTAKKLWHREDALQVRAFCACRGELYAIDGATGRIVTMGGSGERGEEAVSWMVQTGSIGANTPDAKYLSKITVRMALTPGSAVRILAQYDSAGGFETLAQLRGTSLGSFTIPVHPRRCDHLRLRIEGEGDAKIYAIVRTMEQGSDVF